MYKIGELSRLCSIPVKTLRYYDDIGLLPADVIDKYTGYRYYTPARLADCYQILALKELGFSLEQIREHLSSGDTTAILEKRKAELYQTIADATEKLHRLETLQQLQKGEKPMIPMVIRKAEPITVAYRRQVYHDREEALQMCKTMAEKLGGGRQVLIDYEMSYRTENVDMAVCVAVKGKTNEATMTILCGEDYAAIVCTREKLEEGYGDLIQQIHAYPAQIIGPSYEIELDGQELVELRVPICILTPDKVFPCDRLPESFTDDPDVIGKWVMLDRVPSKEQFLYGHEKSLHLGWLDELYFLPDGKPWQSHIGRSWVGRRGSCTSMDPSPSSVWQTSTRSFGKMGIRYYICT